MTSDAECPLAFNRFSNASAAGRSRTGPARTLKSVRLPLPACAMYAAKPCRLSSSTSLCAFGWLENPPTCTAQAPLAFAGGGSAFVACFVAGFGSAFATGFASAFVTGFGSAFDAGFAAAVLADGAAVPEGGFDFATGAAGLSGVGSGSDPAVTEATASSALALGGASLAADAGDEPTGGADTGDGSIGAASGGGVTSAGVAPLPERRSD